MRPFMNRTRPGWLLCVPENDRDSEYHYALGSSRMDMRALSKAMNSRLSGRGGGSSLMAQGTFLAAREAIEAAFLEERQNHKGWYDGIKQRYNKKNQRTYRFTVVIVVAGINYRRLVDVAAGLMHIVWPLYSGGSHSVHTRTPMRNIERHLTVFGRAAG